MGSRWLKLFRSVLILALVAAGCSQRHSYNSDGTQASGGGSVFSSSAEQVNSTLDLALQLAGESPEKNIFVQFWKDEGSKSQIESIKNPVHVFPAISGSSWALHGHDEDFKSPALDALAHNKIHRIPSGDCLRSNGELRTDASVTELSTRGEICFSIGNLSRIAPSDLLREILSLVLHEVSHLGGAGEPEAQAWQKAFSDYFGVRFGDISKLSIGDESMITMADMQTEMKIASAKARSDATDPKIYALVGRVGDQLTYLPQVNDPIGLLIKLRPKHPELIDLYTNSVSDLEDKIISTFEFPEEPRALIWAKVPIKPMSPELLRATLKDMTIDLDRISDNFQKFWRDGTATDGGKPSPEDK